MLGALIKWVFLALALLLVDAIVPGFKLNSFFSALMAVFIIGILNIFLKPILNLVALPITIITFGLFTLVINTVLFMLASAIVPGFVISGFLSALIASTLFSVFSMLINFSASGLK